MTLSAILEDDQVIPNVAKLIRKLYNALLEEGFTEERAAKIASNYKQLDK